MRGFFWAYVEFPGRAIAAAAPQKMDSLAQPDTSRGRHRSAARASIKPALLRGCGAIFVRSEVHQAARSSRPTPPTQIVDVFSIAFREVTRQKGGARVGNHHDKPRQNVRRGRGAASQVGSEGLASQHRAIMLRG